jgi:CBS domain pair.
VNKILNDIRISEVVSCVKMPPIILKGEDPLITIGFLLSISKLSYALVKEVSGLIGEVTALVEDADGKLIGEVTAADLFEAFHPDYREVWKKLYMIKLKDVARKIQFVSPESPLRTYYYKLKDYKYKDVVVISNEKPISFITPYSLLKYFFLKNKIPDLRIDQIQSKLISAKSNATVKEIMYLMMEKWIRKVMVKGKIVDDKSLVDKIFNINYLSMLKNEPDKLLNMPVKSIEGLLKDPETYSKNDSIYEISKKVLNSETSCAISEDYKYIITPYDIAIKPFINPTEEIVEKKLSLEVR